MSRSIVFAIDVEPDGRGFSAADPWAGTALAILELSSLREQLTALTAAPVHLNWFLRFDPQIEQTWGRADWITQSCPDLLEHIREHGDFTGIHPHFWKWDVRRHSWFNEFADLRWRLHCLRSSIAGYESVFGTRPIACRFGDRSLSNDLAQLLPREGLRYDLTLEPGLPGQRLFDDSRATGPLPDHRRALRVPYSPSAADYLVPASGNSSSLWMVPLSTTLEPVWTLTRRPPFLVNTCRPLNLVLHPRTTWATIAAEIARPAPEPLVMILRSGDLSNRRFLSSFRHIATHLASHEPLRQCRFVSVPAAVDAYRSQLTHEAQSVA
jgi:hypothetical protein